MSKHDQDQIKIKRPKKADKAKERYKRNGKYSTKHLRIRECNEQVAGLQDKKTKK